MEMLQQIEVQNAPHSPRRDQTLPRRTGSRSGMTFDDTELFKFWENIPGGLMVGRTDDFRWQAAFQGAREEAFQGDSPREVIKQALEFLSENKLLIHFVIFF